MAYDTYYSKDQLPLKPGDWIVLPKGTPVSTRFPVSNRGIRELKRKQTIRVHHVLPGSTLNNNGPSIRWPGSGGYWREVHLRDLARLGALPGDAGREDAYSPNNYPQG